MGRFYKYATASAATAILRNKTVRWSKPAAFNDPFDIQFDMQFPFEMDELRSEYRSAIFQVMTGKVEVGSNVESPSVVQLTAMLSAARQILPKMDEKAFLSEFGPAIDQGVSDLEKNIPKLKEALSEVVRHSTVFCVSEVPDNLLMWSHYADAHRGAVIEFETVPELDTFLCGAFPVTYSEKLPEYASIEELIGSMLGQTEIDSMMLLRKLVSTKSADWAYEREWRVVAPHPRDTTGGLPYEEIPIHSAEVVGIRLGCRIDQADAEELVSISRNNYERAEVLQARQSAENYALDFEPVP